MKETKLTIPALDKLQQEVPEISLLSLHTNFQGFCSIELQLPESINNFLKEFLQKAAECTDANECQITLLRDGRLVVNLVLPNRNYPIELIHPLSQEELQ